MCMREVCGTFKGARGENQHDDDTEHTRMAILCSQQSQATGDDNVEQAQVVSHETN